jgi:DNA helicase-2/ATP-dependent DNA helicase PcrA
MQTTRTSVLKQNSVKLNSEQQEAITQMWGPSLVVAGAGSGKTTVLTERIAYLIDDLKQAPHSVLAVTFTNKAANEMKERLIRLLGSHARYLNIGTFHSICARLLRLEIENYQSKDNLSWGRNFVIYDETDTLSLVKLCINDLNLDEKIFNPRDMLRAISSLKNDGYTASVFAESAKHYKDARLAEIFLAYQKNLARNNALDFDDLILVFTDILDSNAQVRSTYQERFKHILVDEFQDTNQSQYKLVKLLSSHGNSDNDWSERSLMVVGDVDQSIYSWRKADYRIILGFQKDFSNARLIKLEDNYRSTSTILKVANSIIKNNSERIEKTLRCNRSDGSKVKCYAASDEIDESYFVVEELKRLKIRGIRLSDCAILYRTNAQSRSIEETLIRGDLPYTLVGATRFYDRAEIKDSLAYLKLIYNDSDNQSFLRIINNPRRGLGKTTLEKLLTLANRHEMSLSKAISHPELTNTVGAKAAKTLQDFGRLLARWQQLSIAIPVSQLVQTFLSESGYLTKLQEDASALNDETAFGRVENVRELVAVAQEFESLTEESSLESFLTRISLVSDIDSLNKEQDSVKLMTIHSAKGLEFPSVFIIGLEEGLFPHIRSLNSPTQLEEERRLMYVGITRACDRLYLSYSRQRFSFANFTGASSYTIASRFLNEIDLDCLTGFSPEPDSPSPASSSWKKQSNGYEVESSPQKRIAFRSQTGAKPTATTAKSEYIDTVANNFEPLSVGDKVIHSKFGVGVVTQIIGEAEKQLYNVDFQSAGKRLLDPRFAKLTKLN